MQNSASKKKKEKERCLGTIEKLKEEQKEQEQHTQRIKEWLKHEQDNWIPSSNTFSQCFIRTHVATGSMTTVAF